MISQTRYRLHVAHTEAHPFLGALPVHPYDLPAAKQPSIGQMNRKVYQLEAIDVVASSSSETRRERWECKGIGPATTKRAAIQHSAFSGSPVQRSSSQPTCKTNLVTKAAIAISTGIKAQGYTGPTYPRTKPRLYRHRTPHKCMNLRSRRTYRHRFRYLRRQPSITPRNGIVQSRSGLHSASMIIHMSWAQIRLAAYSQGSRPSAEVPETSFKVTTTPSQSRAHTRVQVRLLASYPASEHTPPGSPPAYLRGSCSESNRIQRSFNPLSQHGLHGLQVLLASTASRSCRPS